jgi:hypothetical protein
MEVVYQIERHAPACKYNIINKNIAAKNQQDIKSLSIPKNSIDSFSKGKSLIDSSYAKAFPIPSKKPQCKIKFTHKLKSKHWFNLCNVF